MQLGQSAARAPTSRATSQQTRIRLSILALSLSESSSELSRAQPFGPRIIKFQLYASQPNLSQIRGISAPGPLAVGASGLQLELQAWVSLAQ